MFKLLMWVMSAEFWCASGRHFGPALTQVDDTNAFIYTECKCASITAFYLKLDLNAAFIFLMKE